MQKLTMAAYFYLQLYEENISSSTARFGSDRR